VRPPTLPRAPAADEPTLVMAEPAEDVTRDSPSIALDCASAAFCFAAAVASDVEEALRTLARRTADVDCRSITRDAAKDILSEKERTMAMEWLMVALGVGCEVEAPVSAFLRENPRLARARVGQLFHGLLSNTSSSLAFPFNRRISENKYQSSPILKYRRPSHSKLLDSKNILELPCICVI
jgi:hypothetical protein